MNARTIPFVVEPGQRRKYGSACPDFQYIRDHVPIISVARELGIRVLRCYRARCWRVENHEHGDRTPSLSFQVKKNRGMCFVCDSHTWSNLDLVMLYLDCSLKEAAHWIIERFPVSSIPAGAHIEKREAWFPKYRSGINENVLTLLIKSGIWCDLTPSEQAILAVLITFTDSQDHYAEISYRGIMRYSGVASRTTVAAAIRRFEKMGVLKITKRTGTLHFRGVSRYTLTIDDPKFDAMLMERFRKMRQEIAVEKEMRARAKKDGRRSDDQFPFG